MFEEYKIKDWVIPYNGSKQWIYKFPNRYGASIVCGQYTYGGPQGLFELAVFKFDTDTSGLDDGSICYDTPIADDVVGYLSEDEVTEYLQRIFDLPANQAEGGEG